MRKRRPTKRRPVPSLEYDVWPRRGGVRSWASGTGVSNIPQGYATDLGDTYTTSARMQVVHAPQYAHGLRVYRSQLLVKKKRSGRVRFGGPAPKVPPDLRTRPRLMPIDALEAAVAFLRQRGALPKRRRIVVSGEQRFTDLTGMPTVLLAKKGLAEPARLHLEVFPLGGGKARLAWVCHVAFDPGPRCEIVVSADATRPRILFCTRASSCSTSFNAGWIRFPRDAATQLTFPMDVLATPDGSTRAGSRWLAAAGNAAGPNVSCHQGSRSEAERLPSPEADNVFVWCNLLHDFFAAFGFDAAHGAFEGEDRLRVNRFSEKVDAAAEFINDVDGRSPTMALHASPFPDGRPAAHDPGVLIHEYTHGVSCRLLGGSRLANPFFGRQARGLNEGYSDYFALTLLSLLGRRNAPPRRLREFGSGFHPPSIRDYRTFAGRLDLNEREEHLLGMVWCSALLEARDRVATAIGNEDTADRVMWQALIDSLKACSPICQAEGRLTFTHAKDALVTAAQAIQSSRAGLGGVTQAIRSALGDRGI